MQFSELEEGGDRISMVDFLSSKGNEDQTEMGISEAYLLEYSLAFPFFQSARLLH